MESVKGNSFALGNSMGNGRVPWTWQGGYQAPPPVTSYDFTEGRNPE